MTELERNYLEALREENLRFAETFNAPSMRGALWALSDLYCDNAHFICELLQNADDQKATEVNFTLRPESLTFTHNAPRKFTISNPVTHAEDRENGTLGDVNSLLSLGSSSKSGRSEEIPIGKFGLGFKSVFQYTDRPEVHDDNFHFAIENFIVPVFPIDDREERREGETLFYFPFREPVSGHSGEDGREESKQSVPQVLRELSSLDYHTLFLNSIISIKWEYENEEGIVERKGEYSLSVENAGAGEVPMPEGAALLKYISRTGKHTGSDESPYTESRVEKWLWKFTAPVDGLPGLNVGIVYFIDKKNVSVDTSCNYPLYCFLPTKYGADYPFIMHAPFQLTINRESIRKNEHNDRMVEQLARLAADSFSAITRTCRPWLNDSNFGSFFPPVRNELKSVISLEAVDRELCKAVSEGKTLWSVQLGRYLSVEEACVADGDKLPELYPSGVLAELLNDGDSREIASEDESVEYGWVLDSLKRRTDSTRLLARLGLRSLDHEDILRKMNENFLGRRDRDWLLKWYASLLTVKDLWRKDNSKGFLRYKNIILTEEGNFAPPYSRGQIEPQVYLPKPDEDYTGINEVRIVNRNLLASPETVTFLKALDLREWDDCSYAIVVSLKKMADESLDTSLRLKAFGDFASKYCNAGVENRRKMMHELTVCGIPCLPASCLADVDDPDSEPVFTMASRLKLPNELNRAFFKENKDILFVSTRMLGHRLTKEESEAAICLLDDIDGIDRPLFQRLKIDVTEENESLIPDKIDKLPPWYGRHKKEYEYFSDWTFQGLEVFIDKVLPANTFGASEILATLLAGGLPAGETLQACYRGKNSGVWQEAPVEPGVFEILRNLPCRSEYCHDLCRQLGLPVKDDGRAGLEALRKVLSDANVGTSADKLERLSSFLKNALGDFLQQESIRDQHEKVLNDSLFTIAWLRDLLNLRLKYSKEGSLAFLVESLLNVVESLEVDEESDLRMLLGDNINIIYGPPGTGKTTRIAEIVKDKMSVGGDACRILVLSPTNQSADVVADRINEKCGCIGRHAVRAASSSEDVRLGLEKYSLVSLDEEGGEPEIIVSTVHHYFLDSTLWNTRMNDVVFIDEASMVTLDYVLLALLKCEEINPACEFYIAGDPMQLPAITDLDPDILEMAQLDYFNFFEFIGLREFSKTPASMDPSLLSKFKIELLDHQYRSREELTDITGRFAYGGKLISDRKTPTLNLPQGVLPIFNDAVTFVRFPVSEKDSKVEMQRLTDLCSFKGSNYNIYSALLVREILQYFFNQIENSGLRDMISIGVITAYTAQKKLISELLNAENRAVRYPGNITVNVNTVHRFQGGEFDIVFLILNPPSAGLSKPDLTLINKKYLINVAVSRAKDHLVILYPDDETCNTANIQHINRKSKLTNIEMIAEDVLGKSVGETTYTADEIEKMLFGISGYLESSCIVTDKKEVNFLSPARDVRFHFQTGADSIDIFGTDNT